MTLIMSGKQAKLLRKLAHELTRDAPGETDIMYNQLKRIGTRVINGKAIAKCQR
jgi:hypothetical protein